jgi:hypothetical protein
MEVSLTQQQLPLCHGGPAMQGKTKENWMQFCEQAAIEQDPDKLLKLVAEINQMLEEKEIRLTRRAAKG